MSNVQRRYRTGWSRLTKGKRQADKERSLLFVSVHILFTQLSDCRYKDRVSYSLNPLTVDLTMVKSQGGKTYELEVELQDGKLTLIEGTNVEIEVVDAFMCTLQSLARHEAVRHL
jgi:mRNA capping enzyme, beta chain